jgi:hypothetical protein
MCHVKQRRPISSVKKRLRAPVFRRLTYHKRSSLIYAVFKLSAAKGASRLPYLAINRAAQFLVL